jgi:hypothetical protein
MHHLQEVFKFFKEHNFKFHLGKCQFFYIPMEYLGQMIYLASTHVLQIIN